MTTRGEKATASAKYSGLSTTPRKSRVAPVEMTMFGVM